MRHVDFSPLYRSTVGFDRLFSMLDGASQPEQAQTYPPYNIERTGEATYRVTMAVAGFDETELSIEAHANVLTVKGEKSEEEGAAKSEYLYRGIAKRAFERHRSPAQYPGNSEATPHRHCSRRGGCAEDHRGPGGPAAGQLIRTSPIKGLSGPLPHGRGLLLVRVRLC
jgi:HSP20 family molecular chaperone IbpA